MSRLISTLADHLVGLAAWSVHRATLALKAGHRSRGWAWLGVSDFLFAGSELARYLSLRCRGANHESSVDILARAYALASQRVAP